ncbi:MAG TPA: TonB C-terminal domain-containing protein [Candidatus Hydrogenedentes bacterium]|nr:TonB C-terminal domain-containing protein [Candidatus Hydrogenedentota bacterium]HPG68220.1 TonB C-terminal domain-containing protein [Candidatus Hydrogenedentota bacterium]
MSYPKRLGLAAACSLAVHAALLLPLSWWPTQEVVSIAARPEPIVINLEPEPPAVPRRLIDTHTEADEPVEPTDLISDRDSKAQDTADVDGERPAPFSEKPAEFDDLGDVASPAPAAEAAVVPTTDAEAVTHEASAASKAAPAEQVAQDTEVMVTPEEVPRPAIEDPERGESTRPEAKPMQLAQAEPMTPSATAPPKVSEPARGRVDGGVNRVGLIGFEAVQDKLAPYLLEVRNRVEREWRAALALKYSGTSPTKAVLTCSIQPDGRLAKIEIIAPGDSASYAPLCKNAVERAAPFPPFPFEVPSMYRSRNLELTWTFSYLED